MRVGNGPSRPALYAEAHGEAEGVSDYQHSAAFEKLCDLADQGGLQVRLRVSAEPVLFAQRKGEEYRQLERIELWLMGALRTEMPVAAAPIYDEDLEAAALDLLTRVA